MIRPTAAGVNDYDDTMSETGLWAAWMAGAYLAGSIPFGLLMGFSRGIDIRRHGSGNVGATNAGRILGRRWGAACFALDALKGLTPVLAYSLLSGAAAEGTAWGAMRPLGVAAAAILGHVFPLWLGFRGGKGVATGLGVLLGLWPVLTLPAILVSVVWFAVVKATGYISAASIAAAAALPVLALASALVHGLGPGEIAVYVGVTAMLAGVVVLRHRSNIARLRTGTEPKVAWTKRERD